MAIMATAVAAAVYWLRGPILAAGAAYIVVISLVRFREVMGIWAAALLLVGTIGLWAVVRAIALRG